MVISHAKSRQEKLKGGFARESVLRLRPLLE
jgi:hypothetical protein